MSGNFVQRGEPSVIDKWSRAEIAIKNGIDLVVELPFVYSIQDARGFSYGAISLLSSMGVVDSVVFGSESSNIKRLKNIASILIDEPEEFKFSMKSYLKKGLSFPNARRYALSDTMNESADLISKSNDILGLEYVYSLMKLKSSIEPMTIKRQGADYNDPDIKKTFSSATAIRRHIRENNDLNVDIPNSTKQILDREFKLGKGPIFYEDMSNLILSVLNVKTENDLKIIHGVTEGLENRIKKFLPWSESLDELLGKIKTKRFTYTRLKRTMLNILFGITKEDIEIFNLFGPQYIKILGFNEKGKEILSKMRERSSLPIIVLSSQFYRKKKLSNEINYNVFERQFKLELTATQIYKLLFKDLSLRKNYSDFREPLYIV
jgi:predicted nucleotidyltransferase